MRHTFSVALLMLTQAACVTRQVTRESVATPQSIAMLGSQTGIAVRLRGGTEIQMGTPIDYGDAYCGAGGCALKSEIASIVYTSNEIDAGSTAATYGTVALFAEPLALVTMAFAAKSLGAGDDATTTEDKSEPLTPELEKRVWLDGLSISNKRIIGRQGNRCVDASRFATDAAALGWIGEHREEVLRECLGVASFYILEHPELNLAQTGMELWALHAVRNRWDAARCKTLPDIAPLAPPVLESLGRRGDERFPPIIETTLADEKSYAYAIDLEKLCSSRGGVSDESDWPARLAQIRAAGPFPKSASDQ